LNRSDVLRLSDRCHGGGDRLSCGGSFPFDCPSFLGDGDGLDCESVGLSEGSIARGSGEPICSGAGGVTSIEAAAFEAALVL
jgi:hypothetical protein